MPLKMFSGQVMLYGAITVMALATTISPAYANKKNIQDLSPSWINPTGIDAFSFVLELGIVHASFDICKIDRTDLKKEAEEAMATARYIAVARYKQQGDSAALEAHDEQQAYNNYQVFHKQDPSAPGCNGYQRQIYALIYRGFEVGATYIHNNEMLNAKEGLIKPPAQPANH